MGRHQGAARSHFINLNEPCNKSQFYHHCRHCKAAHEKDASVALEKIIGRQENFKKHLSRCPYALTLNHQPNTVLPREYLTPTRTQVSKKATSSGGKQTEISRFFSVSHNPDDIHEFERLLLEFQADNQLPDTFVDRLSTKRLFTFMNPVSAASIPSRRLLGGCILDEHASKGLQQDTNGLRQLQDKTGGRVNFLSDVWQNIAKSHLLGCQLTLFGSLYNFGLYETGSRHDGLAVAVQLEQIINTAIGDGWVIGAVVTNNAGQCGRARRILALRWPNIAFLIYFAHDINNLVKAVLQSSFREVTAMASTAVNCLNASSSKWLVRARETMVETYGCSCALITLCETRWNSMQACFASLLRVRCSLEVFAVKHRDDPEFPAVLAIFDQRYFWEALRDAEVVVRPLCFASYKLQCDENTLADVIICFRDIYDGFVASTYRSELVPLVEKRWQQCEQPLIMLALFLHPAYLGEARALPSTSVSSLENICTFAIFYYKRLIGGDPGALRGDVFDWIRGSFIDASLDDFQGCSLPPFPAYWSFAKDVRPTSALPPLAIALFSIAVNTATCERYFSELALIHTARRNRMSVEKAKKISVVRKSVRDFDRAEIQKRDDSSPAKRIVNPSEPEKLVAYGTPNRMVKRALSASPYVREAGREPEAEQSLSTGHQDTVMQEEELVDGGDPVSHWELVFDELVDSGDDDDIATTAARHDDDSTISTVHLECPPYPNYNDKNFPQERTLDGLRGQKASLEEMFMVNSLVGGIEAASEDTPAHDLHRTGDFADVAREFTSKDRKSFATCTDMETTTEKSAAASPF
ncbi:hypothetical protein FI667_g16383, partial [Globisporangium splendens]